MKTFLVLASTIIAAVAGAGEEPKKTVSWRDIGRTVEIVGRLGVPIGTVVKIEATLLSGNDHPNASHMIGLGAMRYLRVESVDGVPSEEKPLMHFSEDPPMPPSIIKGPEGTRTVPSPNVPLSEMELGTTVTLYAMEYASTSINARGGPEDQFNFVSQLLEPDKRAGYYFRTRLRVEQPYDAAAHEAEVMKMLQQGAADPQDDDA